MWKWNNVPKCIRLTKRYTQTGTRTTTSTSCHQWHERLTPCNSDQQPSRCVLWPSLTRSTSANTGYNTPEMTPVTYANILMFPDISKVLLRRKLFISRLYQFCDKPETYFVWKSSFKSVLTDLHITDFEQLGLLVMCLNQNPAHVAWVSGPPTQTTRRKLCVLYGKYLTKGMVQVKWLVAYLTASLPNFLDLAPKIHINSLNLLIYLKKFEVERIRQHTGHF